MGDLAKLFTVAGITLLGKIVYDWLAKGRNGHSAGSRTPDYWERRFREIFVEVLEERAPLMTGRTEQLQKSMDENHQLLIRMLELLGQRRGRN